MLTQIHKIILKKTLAHCHILFEQMDFIKATPGGARFQQQRHEKCYSLNDTIESSQLTSLERRVLQMISDGDSTPKIAKKLGYSKGYVMFVRTGLLKKFEVHRIELAIKIAIKIAVKQGLII